MLPPVLELWMIYGDGCHACEQFEPVLIRWLVEQRRAAFPWHKTKEDVGEFSPKATPGLALTVREYGGDERRILATHTGAMSKAELEKWFQKATKGLRA